MVVCVCRVARGGFQDVVFGGGRRKTTTISVDQSPWLVEGGVSAHVHPSVVSLVWVPRTRPQTYHFFGDSRRGNILVLVLVLVLTSSPRHTVSPAPSPSSTSNSVFDSPLPAHSSFHFSIFFSPSKTRLTLTDWQVHASVGLFSSRRTLTVRHAGESPSVFASAVHLFVLCELLF